MKSNNLRSKPTTSCFLVRFSGPEGTEVKSRGRARCAKPTGVKQQGLKTLKGVKQSARFDPFRVGRCNRLVPWASRKAAYPRLLTFILSGWFGCGLSRAVIFPDMIRTRHLC